MSSGTLVPLIRSNFLKIPMALSIRPWLTNHLALSGINHGDTIAKIRGTDVAKHVSLQSAKK